MPTNFNLGKDTKKGQLPLKELAISQAQRLLKSAEIRGLPETKLPTWFVHRGAYTAGMISGVELGYELATRLAAANGEEKAADEGNQPAGLANSDGPLHDSGGAGCDVPLPEDSGEVAEKDFPENQPS